MNNETLQFLKAVPPNILSTKLKILALEEGVRSHPYKCTSGKITIGIGRNLEDNPLSVREIYYLWNLDMDNLEIDLVKLSYYEELSEIRKLALINMIFNMGFSKFRQFKKLNAALVKQDFKLAAGEIRDSLYWRDKYTHDRAERIALMIETNKMSKYYEL